MDNTQSKVDKDSQSFDDAMRMIWGPTWGKFRDTNGKDDFQKTSAPDMNKGQASKELPCKIDKRNKAEQELAAVKRLITRSISSLQFANDKITKISEALTSGSLSNEENNRNNNSIFARSPQNNNSISKREDNNSNSQNSNKTNFRAFSSGSGESSSSDESSGDGERDSADNSGNSGRRRRRRKSKRMQRSGKNDSNFISSSSSARTNNSSNSNLHTDADLQSLKEKIKDLENKSAVWESQIKSLKGKSQAVDPRSAESSYELQLQEDEQDDINQLKALFSDLGADVHLDDTKFFRTGRSLEKCRPLILQLESQEEKAKILFNAKKLKNNKTWTGVSITHDLTKQQCQTEKLKEMELKKEAVEKNSRLSQEEKSTRVWKVVGGRGTRCLILRNIEKPQNQG